MSPPFRPANNRAVAAIAGSLRPSRSSDDGRRPTSGRFDYVIQGTTFFEIGLGDFDGGTPGNLTRVTVLTSSNSNALVALPVGVSDVFTRPSLTP